MDLEVLSDLSEVLIPDEAELELTFSNHIFATPSCVCSNCKILTFKVILWRIHEEEELLAKSVLNYGQSSAGGRASALLTWVPQP